MKQKAKKKVLWNHIQHLLTISWQLQNIEKWFAIRKKIFQLKNNTTFMNTENVAQKR